MFKKTIATTLIATMLFAAAPLSALASTANVISGVNFRPQPSVNSTPIRLLSVGETVTILEQTNSAWYKVRDSRGRTGYVSTDSAYLRVQSASSQLGTIQKAVSFRTQPSTSSRVTRLLQSGEQVTIMSQPNSYWYQVRDSSGVIGYVSARSEYIRIGTASGGGNTGTGTVTANAQKVINAGMKYLGTPYEFGSNRSSTRTFDCSAFVRRAFLDGLGITLPSNSRTQGAYVKSKGNTTTNWRNLKPGDLMFFMDYKGASASSYRNINKSNQTISHVGIYLGNGRILHTYSKASGGVRTDSIVGNHWEYRFLFGGSAM